MGQLALLFIATLIAIGQPSSVVSKAVISTQADQNVSTDLNRAPSLNKTSESSLSPDQFIVPVIDQMTKESQTEKLCELITSLGHMCQAETDKDLKKKCKDTVKYAKTKAFKAINILFLFKKLVKKFYHKFECKGVKTLSHSAWLN